MKEEQKHTYFDRFKSMDVHRISLEQLAVRFHTNLRAGLTQIEAERRLADDGPNSRTQLNGTHEYIKFLFQMISPLCLFLWVDAIFCFIAYGVDINLNYLYLGIILCGVAIINGFFTYCQIKYDEPLESFKDFIPPSTTVIRNGIQRRIDGSRLVIGDVVSVELGRKIPADLRLIESIEMKVDNSSLTGQNYFLKRSVQCTSQNILETQNVAFSGALIREGTGKGIVFATGDRTLLGQIQMAANIPEKHESFILQEIKRIIFRLAIFTAIIGGILFCIGFAVGYPAILNLNFAIGIMTANIPETLMIQIFIGLIGSARRLSNKKFLTKKSSTVYNLSTLSCICSDKTGTLTMNKMLASHMWFSGQLYKAANKQKFGSNYNYEYDTNSLEFKSFQEAAVNSSVATFDREIPNTFYERSFRLTEQENNERRRQAQIDWEERLRYMNYLDMPTVGDASESALIRFFQPISDVQAMRQLFPVVRDADTGYQCQFLFDYRNKYAFIIKSYETQNSHYCLFLKGAPEKLWKMCDYIDKEGEIIQKSNEWEKKFIEINNFFGQKGHRVLAFAKIHLPKEKYTRDYKFKIEDNSILKNICFVGMFSLTDPPRQGVPKSVLQCRLAGIKVIMVTGDQPLTATAVAKQCNVITQETVNEIAERTGKTRQECFNESDAIVIHGDELTQMALEEEQLPEDKQGKKLEKWLKKTQISFARTSPAQKLTIVRKCKQLGFVVSATGDGVGDSPALKASDIGISMGITGTDVAKDAAEAILLNDDFSSIVQAVKESRIAFDNLKKSICYVLTGQTAQMLPFIAFIIFQIPLPMTAAMVLYMSIGTDFISAIVLLQEPSELNVMTRRPRSKNEHLMNWKMMIQAYGYIGWTEFWGGMFCYYVVANDFGFPPSQLQFTANSQLFPHDSSDVFNPSSLTFGNSQISLTDCNANSSQLTDWIFTLHSSVDLRMSLLSCKQVGSSAIYSPVIEWGECKVQQISPFSNKPVCFTTEGIKYAQSAYFYGVVFAQMANLIVCRTQTQQIFTQLFLNANILLAMSFAIGLVLMAAFIQPLNTALGTRDNIFAHFGVPVIPFAILLLCWSEIVKYLSRNIQANKYHDSR